MRERVQHCFRCLNGWYAEAKLASTLLGMRSAGRGDANCRVPSLPYTLLPQEEVKAATQELERLIEEGVFQRDDCGLLHGQMPPVEKDAVLARFKAGQLKLLVR